MRIARPSRPADLYFRALGVPKPAGSKTTGAVTRKDEDGNRVPVLTDAGRVKTFVKDSSGAAGENWRAAVASAGAEAMAGRDLFSGPLYVEMTFLLSRPKGHYGSGRNSGCLRDSAPPFPATRPDAGKLERGTYDALTGVVWRDDSLAVAVGGEKVYAALAEPLGVEVRVWCLPATVAEARSLAGVLSAVPAGAFAQEALAL